MRFFENKSVSRIWVISYVVMMLLVICTNLFLINNTANKLREEQNSTNRYYLDSVTTVMDNVFYEAEKMCYDISNNTVVKNFSHHKRLTEQTRMQAVGVVNELSNLQYYNKYIFDFICYYPQSDVIVTPNKFSESSAYYALEVYSDDKDYEQWKEELVSANKYENGVLRTVEDTKINVVEITYAIDNDGDDEDFVIRFYVKNEDMFPVIKNENSKEQDVLVVANSKGKVYISSDGQDYDFSDMLIEDEYEIKKIEQNGKSRYLYYFRSKSYQYKYLLLTATNKFYKSSIRLFVVGILLSLVCILGMFAVMYFITTWNKMKINSILNELGIEEISDVDEYSYIQNKITMSRKNNEELQDRLDVQANAVKKSFLSDYINGYIKYGDISKSLSAYNIVPKYDYFYIIAIYVRDYGILSDDAKKNTEFVINNILEDLTDTSDMILTKVDEVLVYVVNSQFNSREKQSVVVEVFEKVKKLSNEMLGIDFAAGVSEIKMGMENLPILFRQATAVLGYERFYDTGGFAFYDEVGYADEKIKVDVPTMYNENEFMMCIKTGARERATEIAEEIFSVSHNSNKGKWYYEGLAYKLFSNMIAFAERNSGDDAEKVIELANKIEHNHTLGDIKNMINDAINIVCDGAENETEEVNEIYNRTREYVDEHFFEHDLDVSKIGEVLEMTPFYVSRIFKRCSGVKLGTYINDLRIEKAKRLLVEEKGMKVNEVAFEVGFENPRTFLKIFKDKEGVTPTQYRKLK